jgi:hypothetical protein
VLSNRTGMLIDQLKRELQLPRWARSAVNEPEPCPAKDVGGKTEIDQIENIEELGTELQSEGISSSALADHRVFNERDVEIIEPGPTKGVTAESPGAASVRPGPVGQAYRNIEERSVGAPHPKVIFSYSSTGREGGLAYLIWPVSPV